jgi:hypothetical protein
VATLWGGAMPALAQATVRVDCAGLTRSACDAAVENIRRAPYVGPIRPATEPLACARVVSYRPVPVEWVDSARRSNWREGTLVTSTGIPYTEPFALRTDWVVTESCIPRRLLNGVSELTLCTGLDADGFHWRLTAAELDQLRRTGHFTSYVPFLRDRDRDSLSRNQVTAAYRARYGTQ